MCARLMHACVIQLQGVTLSVCMLVLYSYRELLFQYACLCYSYRELLFQYVKVIQLQG